MLVPVVRAIAHRRADPRIVGELREVIRADRYRVVDGHNVQSQLWGHLAARAEGVDRLVTTVHSEYRWENPGTKGWLHDRVLRWNSAWGCSFVAVGVRIADYLGEILPPDTRLTRQDLGWSETDPVVGVIGRLAPAKGHSVLIDALKELDDRGMVVRCLIVGDGVERQSLERKTQMLGLGESVRFTGFREDIGSVMDLIDFLCMPSLTEGLPYVMLEAASAGVPLVATAVGEIAHLLEEGVDALLVAPDRPHELSLALERAITTPDEGRRRAESAQATLTRALGDDWIARTIEVYRGDAKAL